MKRGFQTWAPEALREQCLRAGRASAAKVTPEMRRAAGRAHWAKLSPEEKAARVARMRAKTPKRPLSAVLIEVIAEAGWRRDDPPLWRRALDARAQERGQHAA